MRTVRLGTRGSALARAQAGLVGERLEALGLHVETVIVETAGDRRRPDTAWGEGAFVKEIERALLERRIDVAVHSAKDVPTDEAPGLLIAAYMEREDPRDALVARGRGATLETLPPSARVGTDSPRRTAFLLASRPDLHFHPLHGNVDTRLRRLEEGQSDALILALAGLARLGRAARLDEILAPTILPPAPGQGALAVQVRKTDMDLVAALAAIDHQPTRLAVEAERAFLRLSGGGCRAPIGALAEIVGAELVLRGGYARADGGGAAFAEARGALDDGARLARRVVDELEARIGPRASLERPRVLVTRPGQGGDALALALRRDGLEPVVVPTIAIVAGESDDFREALQRLDAYDWVVVASASGARALARVLDGRRPDRVRWAAVGEATAAALAEDGLGSAFVPLRKDALGLADELPLRSDERVLVPRAAAGTEALPERLRARGALVDEVVAYRTVEGPEESRAPLARALRGEMLRAVLFASASSVRGLRRLAPADLLERALGLPAVCIGRSTAAAARKAGFRRVVTSPEPAPGALAAVARKVVEQSRETATTREIG